MQKILSQHVQFRTLSLESNNSKVILLRIIIIDFGV